MDRFPCSCSLFKAVLRRRDAIQMEYEMTLEEMTRKKEEKDQVSVLYSCQCISVFGKDFKKHLKLL